MNSTKGETWKYYLNLHLFYNYILYTKQLQQTIMEYWKSQTKTKGNINGKNNHNAIKLQQNTIKSRTYVRLRLEPEY